MCATAMCAQSDSPADHRDGSAPDRRAAAASGWATPELADHWHRHHAGLLRYANYLLGGDQHAAEDVLQEAAIRLWRHPEVLDVEASLGGWLRTVVRHVVIDRLRRQRVRPPETPITPGPGLDHPAGGRGDAAEGDVAAWEAVTTLLAVLPHHHRVVVFDVYVRDRPLDAVAADLGIPIGTVKSRCHHALRRLRAAHSVS